MKVTWEGDLELPPNRPKGRQINITYSYDENQIMQCTFVDVESGNKIEKTMSLGISEDLDIDKINQFIVE